MEENVFSQIDFGILKKYLDDDDVTDISYSNNGQLHLKTLSRGIFRIEEPEVTNAFMEKIAFQCSNAMGKSFNMAHPFLDAEGAELRLNFVHDSIAKNGIACVMRKTPAKIRLEKDKILKEKYIALDIHDFLFKCVEGHCNIVVSGETGSGKTEFIKYLASHTIQNEKIITIEDTLELHLDKIYPQRDIVAMKTNNIASYSDVLVTCMRQNPIWILLSEIRSAEAVTAARNSISSGHYILSTIHADRADSIPSRMYSLLESSQDMEQFLKSIYRYIQIGVHIRGYMNKVTHRFTREIAEVCEFYVDENNNTVSNLIYKKTMEGNITRREPSPHLIDYLERQGVVLPKDLIKPGKTYDADANALAQVDGNVESAETKMAHEAARKEFMGEVDLTPKQDLNKTVEPTTVNMEGSNNNINPINLEKPEYPNLNQQVDQTRVQPSIQSDHIVPPVINQENVNNNVQDSINELQKNVDDNETNGSDASSSTTVSQPKVSFRINPYNF